MIYDNIKSICKEKNIAISKMEAELEFARSSICKWDENTPSVIKVKKVADYLSVKIDKLLE